jgi:hypothetical protein
MEELKEIYWLELEDPRLIPFNVNAAYAAGGGTRMEGKWMYQLLSYVKYCQFMILTFIAVLLWVTGLWTVGVMPTNGILPTCPCPVGLAKDRMRKMRKGSDIRRT